MKELQKDVFFSVKDNFGNDWDEDVCAFQNIYLYIFSNHLDIASSHNVGALCLDWSCILLPGAFDYIDLHFWGSLMMMVLLMECCVVVCMVAKELKEEEKV